jgi:flagellar protein FliO/FliZ
VATRQKERGMQFITGLIGESGTTLLTSALALVAVLALAVLGLWLVKLTMKSTATLGRGRNRRLGVVEQLQIDARRQMLIIRRDDVEHVILVGGGQDVLVEAGIPVVRAAQAQAPVAAARGKLPEPSAGEVPAPATPVRAGERIKDMTRAAALRQSGSLRHTGLMRQRAAIEPEVIPMPPATGDNSGQRASDSATRPVGAADNGRSGIGAARDYGSTGRADGR